MSIHSRPLEQLEMPSTGLLRIKQVLHYVPVSRSSWLQGVKEGRFPRPVKLGKRTIAWRVSDIKELIDDGQKSPSSIESEQQGKPFNHLTLYQEL